MEAVIKKNSTQTLIVDPRIYGGSSINWDEALENAVVTFSLWDVASGCYVVANRAAEIIPGGLSENDSKLTDSVSCGDDTSVTRIAYRFRSRDTKNSGVYRGTFQVNAIGGDTVLAVPEAGDIQIVVSESGIAPWTSAAFTGMPEITEPDGSQPPVLPPGSQLVPHTWYELNSMRLVNNLMPGVNYLLTDYQTIHRIPTQNTIHNGPIEPLIIQAVSLNSFSIVAKSPTNPSDVIYYEFTNEYVRCEDSFDSHVTGAGANCVNDQSVHRPGYIVYREDVINKQSAHYDFRAYMNRVNGITSLSFSDSTQNVAIGLQSGNIIIPSFGNLKIGDNSSGIYLYSVANRTVIGNNVRGFISSGVTLTNRVRTMSVFELGDYGLSGSYRTTLTMRNDTQSFEGTTTIGFIPAGSVISNLQVVSERLSISEDTQVSMGVSGVSDKEVFGLLPAAQITAGVFSAQVSTRPIERNAGLTLTLQDNESAQGRLHVRVDFNYTGGFDSLAPEPIDPEPIDPEPIGVVLPISEGYTVFDEDGTGFYVYGSEVENADSYQLELYEEQIDGYTILAENLITPIFHHQNLDSGSYTYRWVVIGDGEIWFDSYGPEFTTSIAANGGVLEAPTGYAVTDGGEGLIVLGDVIDNAVSYDLYSYNIFAGTHTVLVSGLPTPEFYHENIGFGSFLTYRWKAIGDNVTWFDSVLGQQFTGNVPIQQ